MGRPKIDLPISEGEWRNFQLSMKKANQRLRSMKPGQKEAVEYYTHGKTFSEAKPKTVGEYQTRLREVERFLAAEQTKRSGWEAIKKRAVESAGETLRDKRHYNLTDKELANIFREIDKKSQKQFYKILDIIQAKKHNTKAKGQKWNEDALQQAINQAVKSHMSAGEAIRFKTRAEGRLERASDKVRK